MYYTRATVEVQLLVVESVDCSIKLTVLHQSFLLTACIGATGECNAMHECNGQSFVLSPFLLS